MAAIAEGYPGSKNGAGVWQRIISLMPRHENYFELFLGHGAVMRRKRAAPGINLGCDLDPEVMTWWHRHFGWGSTPRPSPCPTILQEDALRILSTHPAMMDPRTLVYLDPPYLRSVRTRDFYQHEFSTEEQHWKLLKAAKRCGCMVMISGYGSELYRQRLDGWYAERYPAMTRGGVREEFLWMNFRPGTRGPLHDPRYAGDGFRERERIKRKRERWVRRLAEMPAAERQIISEAMREVGGSSIGGDGDGDRRRGRGIPGKLLASKPLE